MDGRRNGNKKEKRVAISQSNYIPWKGYFDLIASVDEFIIYDEVQYTCQDWRNRNLIKTSSGVQWLTIPVKQKGLFRQPICQVEVANNYWRRKHWKSLSLNYKNANYFNEVAQWLEPLYSSESSMLLSDINRYFINSICSYLGITSIISSSSDYQLEQGRNERLISLCHQAGASLYHSGPAAKAYLDEGMFHDSGIQVKWHDYSGYSEYPQLAGEYIHTVSILDLLLNCGQASSRYLKHVCS